MSGVVSEEGFREEAIAFLDANASLRPQEKTGWGEGSDAVSLFPERTPTEEQAEVEESKAWRQKVFDAGFGWITGPLRYGGRALAPTYERIWNEVASQYATASAAPFAIGLGMVAPTILSHGTDALKDGYLAGMYRGDVIACQLFSEPAAGSDLAALQTRAVRDGDEWLVTGQKVWTSMAQFSDIGEIVCRTDALAPKHKGLTGFVVDMRAPGVEVRPLRQMTGGAAFNEVFFTEVRVPDDHRLGDVNQGWSVALTTLMNERASIGAGSGGSALGMNRLVEMLRHFGRDKDPILRDQLMRLYIATKVATYTNQRALAKIRAGQLPGPELSIAKLSLTQNLTAVSDFVADVLGPRLVADTGEWGTYAWADFVCGTPGMRIAGGSDEVMRNIIGERVLGLPKEPPPQPRR